MTREVYIIAPAQSNGVGINSGPAPTYANAARIYRYSQPWHAAWGQPSGSSAATAGAGTWGLASDPLHSDPQCGVGPGMAFADRLITLRGDPTLEIGLVPCGWGGSDIQVQWASSNLYWNAFGTTVARMHAAKAWGPIKGLLSYHGESAANEAVPAYYQAEIYRAIRDLRLQAGANVPAVLTRLGPKPPTGYPGWTKMQQFLDQIDGVDPLVRVVNPPRTLIGDGSAHIDAASAVATGHAWADAMHAMQSL